METPEKLVALRKELHNLAEVSNAEAKTAERVAGLMRDAGADRVLTGVGGHGVIATFNLAANEARAHVMLRCELDALPLDEVKEGDVTEVDAMGASHRCGHDGHMAIMCAVAAHLPVESRRVDLLFQPAEETGEGAIRMLADPRFEVPLECFALHNLPGQTEASILTRAGTFACASRGLEVNLHGQTTHAAHPELGLSPAPALGRIVEGLARLGTVTHVEMGRWAFGSSPGDATILATLRSPSNALMDELADQAVQLVRAESEKDGLRSETRWHDVFRAVENHEQSAKLVDTCALELGLQVKPLDVPMRWSEDFAEFLLETRGAMFCIGAGDIAPLHDRAYEFNDRLIGPAAALFVRLITESNVTLE